MSSQANVRAIEALEHLKDALMRFKGEAQNVLNTVAAEINRTLAWLQERLEHWQKELVRRQRLLQEAQAALNSCRATAYRDPETGRVYVPDCSREEAYARQAKRLVDEAEHELLIVRTHKKRVEETVNSYNNQARRLSGALEGDLVKGTALLSTSATILHSYASGSMGGGTFSSNMVTPSIVGDGWVGLTGGGDSSKFDTAINNALQSGNRDTELEGTVANFVKNDLVDFQKEVGPGGSIGEIDVETTKAIIEITNRRVGKLGQIKKYLSNVEMNPMGKAVILFAPNYSDIAAQEIIKAGGYIVRTDQELLELLQRLGGL